MVACWGDTGATFLTSNPCETPCEIPNVCGPGSAVRLGMLIRPEIVSVDFAPSPTASGAAGSTASTAAGLGATGFGFCVSTTMAPGEASSMVLITLGFGTSNELDGTAGFFV